MKFILKTITKVNRYRDLHQCIKRKKHIEIIYLDVKWSLFKVNVKLIFKEWGFFYNSVSNERKFYKNWKKNILNLKEVLTDTARKAYQSVWWQHKYIYILYIRYIARSAGAFIILNLIEYRNCFNVYLKIRNMKRRKTIYRRNMRYTLFFNIKFANISAHDK